MADNGTVSDKRETVVNALRELVSTLEAEEMRLSAELATVAGQRKDAAKTLASLSGETPRRRRGRPRKTEAAASA